MKLTIVYDDVKTDASHLQSDHGFSCYIETEETVVLFDTGTNGKMLMHNMNKLEKDPEDISSIVISHEHYDHNGGLPFLLKHIDPVTIYRLKNESSSEYDSTIRVEKPIKIADHIWSTGRLDGDPKDEQSLILETKNGIWVLVGCSHSGVGAILQRARRWGKVIGLIGGFHGFNEFSLLEDIDVICPCHCTVHKQKIHHLYPEKSKNCSVGTTIDLKNR